MLARAAAAKFAWERAPDDACQLLGLACLFVGGVEEPAILGEPTAGVWHRQVQAKQLGR